MPFDNSKHQPSFAVKAPAAPEIQRGLDIGMPFGQVKLAVFGAENLLHPGAGLVNALVLLPEAAEDFDEKAAAAASGVRHADFGQLRHELFGAGEIALLAADGGADVVHEFAGEGVDERLGHWGGDGSGRVVDAFVFPVGRQEHLVTLAEDVFVNAPVVVVDNTAAERLVPGVDAEDEIELVAETLEIGRVFVQAVPDALGEDFGVVIFVKELLEEVKELGHDAVRALGFPEFGEAGVFVLREAVMDEAVILDSAGKDELVDEENDGLGGLFGRRPFHLVELVEPGLQIFEELLFEFRLVGGVLDAAQSVEDAAGFTAAGEEVGEGQVGEGLVLEEVIPGVEEPGGPQVRENQVFVVTQILFDLSDVLFGVGVTAPEGVRAVPMEERFEFERERVALALREHEVHPPLAGADLAGGLKTQNILAESGEKVLSRGFRLRAVLEVEDILLNGGVRGNRPGIGRQRQELDSFASDQLTQGLEDIGVIHGQYGAAVRFAFFPTRGD